MGLKAEASVIVSLVDGPCHVVDHRETADGLQKMIIWPSKKHMVIQFFPHLNFSFLNFTKCMLFIFLMDRQVQKTQHRDCGLDSHLGWKSVFFLVTESLVRASRWSLLFFCL